MRGKIDFPNKELTFRQMESHLLRGLTKPQAEAVTTTEGPLLILAGPGSGKTRVMTVRLAYLLEKGVAPHNLLGLTFTNKAADEMRRRLSDLSNNPPVGIGTFHRFCSRLLRTYAHHVGLNENFSIYDAGDSLAFLKSVIESHGINVRQYTAQQICRTISNAKNRLATPEQFRSDCRTPLQQVTAEIYPLYQERLLAANSVDFDDLLMHVANLLNENPLVREELDNLYRYVMVDEYQDTNAAQYQIVRALAQTNPNLAVCGDPDQSIYGWRGADIRNILDFERDYPKVHTVRLEQNYRSTPNILRAADTLIANNEQRKPKTLFTENPEGDAVQLVNYAQGIDESDDIAHQIATWVRNDELRPRDVAILYRTNALSRSLEHALRTAGVPYQIVNGVEFYQRKEIKDVMSYLHLINNPRNDNAFLRAINNPPRGIGKKTLQRLREYATDNRISLLDAASRVGEIESISKRIRNSVTRFVEQYQQIVAEATAPGDAPTPVEEIVGMILSTTGYTKPLESSTVSEDQERLANVQELLTAAGQFDAYNEDEPETGGLDGFLEQVALVNDTDNMDAESDKVTMMTLHAAKGLEFDAVFVIALESGILPHSRSRDDPMQLEEERRLLFVGMTRARRHLQLSMAQYRHFRGTLGSTIPSSFLMELPRAEMNMRNFGHSQYNGGDVYSQVSAEAEYDEYSQVEPEASSHAPSKPADVVNEPTGEPMGRAGLMDRSTHEMPVAKQADRRTQVGLTTAAELTEAMDVDNASNPLERISPDAFRLSMVVKHPEHGLGKIIALSGKGPKRRATVQFFQEAQHRKFILIHSPIRPVES